MSTLIEYKNDGKYWPNETKYLVIVHQYDGDIRWTSKLNFPYIIYNKNKPELEPFTAVNKAKGESNMVKFIAQFYNDLPENIIQVYQYERKPYHHNGSLVDILNSPDFEKKYMESNTEGYWNFNTYILGDIKEQIPRMIQSGFWPKAMEPYFGSIYDYGNFTKNKKGCGQFVVSRERVRSLPRKFYCDLYDWLINNTIGDITTTFNPITKTRYRTNLDNHPNSNFYTSRYLEWTWELIFVSHKNTENISMVAADASNVADATNHNKNKIAALYGAKKYYKNVTIKLIKQYYLNNQIQINNPHNLNKIFGETISDEPNELLISINGNQFEKFENKKFKSNY